MFQSLAPDPAEIRIVSAEERQARERRLWGAPPALELPANVFTLPPITGRRRIRAIGEPAGSAPTHPRAAGTAMEATDTGP